MIARLVALLRRTPARVAQLRGYWGGVMVRCLDYLRR